MWDRDYEECDSMGFYSNSDVQDLLQKVYYPTEDTAVPTPEHRSDTERASDMFMGMIERLRVGEAPI